ncbi:MAG: hypothetical protein QM765_23105 [Myxococcales bacterium]
MGTNIHVFDKAKYHYEGDFPRHLHKSQASVHTGMYWGWIVDRALVSRVFEREAAECLRDFRERRITGAQCYDLLGGVLASDMLKPEGRAFSRWYYELETGQYIWDYQKLLAGDLPSVYHVADTWKNYAMLSKVISRRYLRWRRKAGGATNPG